MQDFNNYKENINKAACERFEQKQSGMETCNSEKKLFFLIYEMLSGRSSYSVGKGENACRILMWDNAIELLPIEKLMALFDSCIQKWQPGQADFYVYFMHFFRLRVISELEKTNMIEKEYYCSEDDDKSEITDRIRDTGFESDTADIVEKKILLNERYNSLIESIITIKKKYDNSTKFCYPLRMFTEYTTKWVAEFGAEKSEEYIPDKALDVIDKAFAAYYLHKNGVPAEVNEFEDITCSSLRMLSDFTGKEADKNSKCGYQLNNIVYTSYIESVKGRGVSESAVTQQRNKFRILVESAGLSDD